MIQKGLLAVLLFFCLIYSNIVSAQYSAEPTKLKEYETSGAYLGSYFIDGMDIARAPFHWDQKEWIIAGSSLATASMIYLFFDDDIRSAFQTNRSSFSNNLSRNFIEPFGSGKYSLPLLGMLYLYGEIENHPRSKTIALNGVKTFVISAAFATVLKQIGKRHRPYQEYEGNSRAWAGPFGDSEYTSFPSGHTTVSFAMASYISSAYKDKAWVGITSYTLATLVGLSRINDDEHWASDVFVGAVLGYAIGQTVFNNSLEKYNIQVLPISHSGLGITLIKTIK